MAAAPSVAAFPNLNRYEEGDILPDKAVFFTGKTTPPPEIAGSIDMADARAALKGKKVKEVFFNYGCT
jgi:hypothetical protein